MASNEQLLTRFYTAFQNSDAESMIACYHEDATFSDPVFPMLKGKKVGAMWALLCQRKADPKDRWFENIQADETTGSAHWEAKYKFPATGRSVHNKIDSHFTFKEGKILTHKDSFDFYAWSRMAFGPLGIALGWSPLFQKFIQKKISKTLEQFIAKR